MIVSVARREGDVLVAVGRVDVPVVFEGSGAQVGVLVSFDLDGEPVTGRILNVLRPSPDSPDAEPMIEVVLVDKGRLDAASETTLANLPQKDDFTTEL